MNKIECTINNKKYEIVLENFKILFGSNYNETYEVYKCLKTFFNKIPYSEFHKENNIRNSILLNDNFIDVRNSLFFEVNIDFDFILDAKLGTKSLILKYLENTLEGIEYHESFNTIKELLYSFINYEIKDQVVLEFNDLNFLTECDDFNMKSLIKYIIPILLKNDLEINNLDLTYQELIVFQIKLINRIAEKCKKNVFIAANIPCITQNILKELNLLNKNIYFIILSNHFNCEIDINNVIFTDLRWLDFSNETTLIDYMMDMPFHYDINELKTKIKESLNYYNFKKILFKK